MAARKPVSTLLWQWTRSPGLERFELFSGLMGWALHGTILTLGRKRPAIVEYNIRCDREWRTRTASISLRDDRGERSLHVERDARGWLANGQRVGGLAGCIDLDLGWSPSTNTIAIRRLQLAVGARSGRQTAAWVRFPELTLEPLHQEYERLARNRYRYTSRGGAFRAKLSVDRNSLLVEYEGFWRRVGGGS
jgi:uncharacterized protein